MDIFLGLVILLLAVAVPVSLLARRRPEPGRPWFPAGTGGGAWDDVGASFGREHCAR